MTISGLAMAGSLGCCLSMMSASSFSKSMEVSIFASNQSASIQVKLQVLDAFGYWCSGSGRYAESGVPLLKLLKDGVKPLLMFRMSA